MSLLWHDYETFGADPRLDWPAQFAALRTDFQLRQIAPSTTLYCRPPRDYLPQVQACLLHGISPQLCLAEGLPEPDFAKAIHQALATPGTISAGYNSIRFDEEFSRQLFWRNFYDVYAREWENGNGRFDLLDPLRMAYALRPEGLQWPMDKGKVSFRLTAMSAANGLAHARAHDALEDVKATIALARLLCRAQPKLWEHALALRNKALVLRLLDVKAQIPVVHVSQRFAAERGCLAVVLPICVHPSRRNEIIVFDLSQTPDALLELGAEEIADRLFVSEQDLPEGEARLALKTVHTNRAPMLAPLSVLLSCDHARLKLDLPRCLRHAEQIRACPQLVDTLRQVYLAAQPSAAVHNGEPELYAGLLGGADRTLLARVRNCALPALGQVQFGFTDPRLATLLWRYRCRNYPDTLSPAEQRAWHSECAKRLSYGGSGDGMNVDRYFAEIQSARANARELSQLDLFDQLEAYGRELIC